MVILESSMKVWYVEITGAVPQWKLETEQNTVEHIYKTSATGMDPHGPPAGSSWGSILLADSRTGPCADSNLTNCQEWSVSSYLDCIVLGCKPNAAKYSPSELTRTSQVQICYRHCTTLHTQKRTRLSKGLTAYILGPQKKPLSGKLNESLVGFTKCRN